MTYDASFYEAQQAGSSASANEVVPILIERFRPRSVVDVGCGVGTWLEVFRRFGTVDVVGVDGSWVRPEMLHIPTDCFVQRDLSGLLDLGRRFDMAVSFEVGEHLPPSAADTLVGSLVGLAPVVVFSAAIPGQGGVQHVNEQWPHYWAERFRARGYVVWDGIRPLIWTNERVKFWYAQNIVVYVSPAIACQLSPIPTSMGDAAPLPLIHPGNYHQLRALYAEASSRSVDTAPVGSIVRALLQRARDRFVG
jgi:SAM-dependent methyltransferase